MCTAPGGDTTPANSKRQYSAAQQLVNATQHTKIQLLWPVSCRILSCCTHSAAADTAPAVSSAMPAQAANTLHAVTLLQHAPLSLLGTALLCSREGVCAVPPRLGAHRGRSSSHACRDGCASDVAVRALWLKTHDAL